MSYPTIEIDQKKVILLIGFERTRGANEALVIKAKDQLERTAKRHGDGVAFGYVAGKRMAGA